jgi:homocysteine S-methyltransferase
VNAMDLPQLAGRPMVTDGGMETDLIFHHGVDLPLFAAFPLIDTAEGRSLLTAYYDEYAAIARRADAGLMLESATWRASSDWGDRLGYSPADLARVNRDAISMLAELRERYRGDLADVVISGMVGPRGDGYQPGEEPEPDEAAGYHAAQVEALAAAGADIVSAYTLTSIGEAIGIVRAASSAGVPAAISFTMETDGRLPGGESLAEAITQVDAAASPAYFQVNCAIRCMWPRPWPNLARGGSGSTACATTPPPGATPSWTRRPT